MKNLIRTDDEYLHVIDRQSRPTRPRLFKLLPYISYISLDDLFQGMNQITNNLDPWCEEQLEGKFCLWNYEQYFEFKEDLALFLLRWGG